MKKKRKYKETFEQIMARARRQNEALDAIDRKHGSVTPHEDVEFMHLRTAIVAIEAGIKSRQFDWIAEGLVMLHDLQKRMEFAWRVGGEKSGPGTYKEMPTGAEMDKLVSHVADYFEASEKAKEKDA